MEQQQSVKPKQIRLAAMEMLAGREYLRTELAKKLAKKFDNSVFIDEVIEQLISDNLQSDERYVQAFLRSRISRGQGEVRIRMELRQRGANQVLADQAITNFEVDWFELARSVALGKFGSLHPVDNAEKAKRIRFLQYRGFNYDQINYALSEQS
jgi:regulatory protein